MTDLLPCPFCGSDDASVERVENAYGYSVWCSECYVEGPGGNDTSETEAMALWNKRTILNETGK